ncbi:hypothetical protein [Stackebrandtia nassauensis]|uniref:Uncharacterized protein n=1 Tax=Stackebrandtia nassauensis (strain DSM 44728 / CIP 108903 / NRRL B-16338 / NBRC 102104 / LLR-40K-21) TaxID=446470 RepID=D3PXI1_STANL|nr:hypothetical protein [Stackebrandtia nassauensis]ADD43311.1 hypothetical protein Snas_3653 [Stackebrandtia nassauensis DSM 44728]
MNRRIFEQNDVPAHVELRLLRLEARVNALAATVRLLAAALPDDQRVALLLDDNGARAQVES